VALVVLPKNLTAKTPARAADVMADLNAILTQVNGNLDAENLVDAVSQALFEAGDLKATGRTLAPTGWLMCQGQAVSRAGFAALFAAIGTVFGGGDGVTTFSLPDLRGRVPVGPDAGTGRLTLAGLNQLGHAGGNQRIQGHTHAAGGLFTDTQNALHSHHLDVTAATRHEGGGFAYTDAAWTPGFHTNTSGDFATHSHSIGGITGLTGEGGSENLQPYQCVNWMVKT
jgi:microcystin-dependent protein